MGTPPFRRADPPGRTLRVGDRVVVRYRLPPGDVAGLTDVVGVLTRADEDSVTVDSRRGPVRVARVDIVAAKQVPPPPSRRGPPQRAIGVWDLERVMAEGWVPVERGGLGDWVLRASGGFTGRANSVLPTGEPSLPLPEAVDFCQRWYRDRDLVPLFALASPVGGKVSEDPLGAHLLGRGYQPVRRTVVMTAAASDVPAPPEGSPEVTVDADLTAEWLQAYAAQRPVLAGVTEQVLTGSRGQLFASVRGGERGPVTAIARMAVSPGWAGLSAVWVAPAHRGSGLARALTAAVATLARANRMPSIYLQVTEDNTAARTLYERSGFATHHTYCYLRCPD